MEIKTTCPYCGTGCGVIAEHDGKQILSVRGDPDHPANFGRLCTKGSTLHLTVAPETRPQRALVPELRTDKQTPRQQVTWQHALGHAAERFAAVIRDHGPDAVAFYISGQLLTEDYYVFNKLAKGLIGTNNIDSNSRLCMSSAVTGYKATLGADAQPCAYSDIDEADCVFITGANTAYAHPIVFRRIEDARARNPELKLIVADPRRTDTAEAADLHLPIQPGSDVALYHGMLHVMLWEGLCDMAFIAAHTEGFDALRETVRDYTPAVAAQLCGVPEADIVTAARWLGARGKKAISLWCQGLNQSAQGTNNNAALIHLHLATGKIGKPGCGPFSLTGQPNAMGGREVGGMANLLSAHRDLANPDHRAEVARYWGVDSVPDKPGLTAVELFNAVADGKIKALWIACTNPAQSMPESDKVKAALAACDFVVVLEVARQTDTTAYADLLLPAAVWSEKDGTVTNSERRITRQQAALPPSGEARPDWRIAADFAHALGLQLGRATEARRLFPYASSEDVFNEHRESTRGRDLDITGLSYELLEQQGPQQWPFPEHVEAGSVRLYEDHVFATPTGRARFVNLRPAPTAEAPNSRLPFRLTTGRLRDQWHGMSRTGTVARLYAHAPEPLLEMNPNDVFRRGLEDGDLVRVKNKRGNFVARVKASAAQRSGQLFMPMHWGGQFMRGGGANTLTTPVFDPISKQPELKHATVGIEKFESQWRVVALFRAPAGEGARTLALHAALQPWLDRCDHATLTLAGREDPVLVFQGWTHGPGWAVDELNQFDNQLGLDDAHALRFMDRKRGISKRARIEGVLLLGVRLAGETKAREWLTDVMSRGELPPDLRRWLLAPVDQPPSGSKTRGKVVCNCFDVSEDEILAEYRSGLTLADLQAKRKCGTSCGSCVPELKRLAAQANTTV
ncbi:MAG TPA: molybdopterin-dependent oxidoreductase [Rhodocyclaceae bacterium]|nr:molybdopterin-dependent oxidoreductase [Rhodocyclaceae bacterium]